MPFPCFDVFFVFFLFFVFVRAKNYSKQTKPNRSKKKSKKKQVLTSLAVSLLFFMVQKTSAARNYGFLIVVHVSFVLCNAFVSVGFNAVFAEEFVVGLTVEVL